MLISLKGVVKDYESGAGTFRALAGINLDIAKGEFVAIMGPSGSGKSTFMNILGCLDKPTAGTYQLDGHDVSGLSREQQADVRNKLIGFVFQGFNLLPRFKIVDNVALPLVYAGMSVKADRLSRAEELLSKVGLAGRGGDRPGKLSGGQQQRVAIARALANQPNLILADEPTGNLDTGTSAEVMRVFQALNDEGVTVVLVTHEADIAKFAKRLVRFRDGHVETDEPVRQERA